MSHLMVFVHFCVLSNAILRTLRNFWESGLMRLVNLLRIFCYTGLSVGCGVAPTSMARSTLHIDERLNQSPLDLALGTVEIHRELMTAEQSWIKAVKL
jgi:hypothetical protein